MKRAKVRIGLPAIIEALEVYVGAIGELRNLPLVVKGAVLMGRTPEEIEALVASRFAEFEAAIKPAEEAR